MYTRFRISWNSNRFFFFFLIKYIILILIIGSHVNDWNLDAPELFPIFEEAEKLGACIFVHPWDMMGQEKMPKYWLPW